ncbi:MAG: carboxypeptidase regulatory-like domain-containing protein, partial [Planctomycetes bacterium]|nr:carboxypeptidase regulatory-like domain-containing protein [Planctomycetota bacterium]
RGRGDLALMAVLDELRASLVRETGSRSLASVASLWATPGSAIGLVLAAILLLLVGWFALRSSPGPEKTLGTRQTLDLSDERTPRRVVPEEPTPAEAIFATPEPVSPREDRIESEGPARVFGIVVSLVTHRPLDGALVEIGPGLVSEGPRFRNQTRSDDSGRFECRDLPSGSRLDLRISAPGHAYAERRSLSIDPTELAYDVGVVLLDEALRCTGSVVDEAGFPVVGAEVTVAGHQSRVAVIGGSLLGLANRGEARLTDTNGRFVLDDLGPGVHQVEVAAEGYRTAIHPDLIMDRALTAPDLEVVLRRGRGCEGRVVDPSGRVVEGATVKFMIEETVSRAANGYAFYHSWRRTRSDADGRFAFHVLPELTATRLAYVEASAQGFDDARRVAWNMDATEVVVTLRRAEVPQFVPEGDGVFRAVVTDEETGRPIDGARVSYLGRADIVAVDGRFELTGLRRGIARFGAISIQADGYFNGAPALKIPEDRDVDAVIRLRPKRLGASIEGRVTDAAGKPVVGARVRTLLIQPSHRWLSTTTGLDGRFRWSRIDPLQLPETSVVVAEHPQFARGQTTATGEALRRQAEVQLEPGRTLRGHVLDLDARPVPRARVFALRPTDLDLREIADEDALAGADIIESTVCDAEGGFVLRRLPAHDLRVVAAADGHRRPARSPDAFIDLPANRRLDAAELRLERGFELRGRLVDEDGRPLAGLTVLRNGSPVAERADPEGWFVFRSVFDRPVTLRVREAAWEGQLEAADELASPVQLVARPRRD